MINRKIGILLIIVGLVLLIISIVNLKPKELTNEEIINEELKGEELQYLLKEMTKYLSSAENINEATEYSVDQMANYAFSYVSYFDKQKSQTSVDEETSIGIISVDLLKEKIEYIFGIKNLDLSKSEYKIENGYISIPRNLQGGDAQIYKYVGTTKDENTDTYIVGMDCLELASIEEIEAVLQGKEYDKKDVIYTLKIKYKVVDGRRILLAYTLE